MAKQGKTEVCCAMPILGCEKPQLVRFYELRCALCIDRPCACAFCWQAETNRGTRTRCAF